MTKEEKKQEIKKLVNDSLDRSLIVMKKQTDRVLNSGAIDIDSWDCDNNPMILIRSILTAILQDESTKHFGGSYWEKKVKKEAKNIMYFL